MCESQEKCRDAVIDLLDDLDVLSISEESQEGAGILSQRPSSVETPHLLLFAKYLANAKEHVIWCRACTKVRKIERNAAFSASKRYIALLVACKIILASIGLIYVEYSGK